MSKPETEVVTSSPQYNGVGARPAARPSVTITVDSDTGRAAVVDSTEDTKSVGAILARAQAKLEAKRATSQAATVETVTSTPEEEPVEEASLEAAADGSDDEIVDPEAPAETDDIVDPGTPPPVAAKPAAAPIATPFEVEQARIDAATARREAAEARTGRRRDEFDAYFETPVASVKAYVASVLGVGPDSPLVAQEMRDLFAELTWDVVSPQDLPDSQQATLQAERLNRKIRLDNTRRQAAKQETANSAKDEQALGLARAEYERLSAADPRIAAVAALAEGRTGQPFAVVVMETLHRASKEGRIQPAGKTDSQILQEGIRLVADHFTREATNLAPLIAALTPASAPSTPGTAPKPNAVKATATSQAVAKPPVKPRTLPAAKAGAAPSRPGTPTASTEPEELSRDPETRRQQISDRYTRRS